MLEIINNRGKRLSKKFQVDKRYLAISSSNSRNQNVEHKKTKQGRINNQHHFQEVSTVGYNGNLRSMRSVNASNSDKDKKCSERLWRV